jgi:uncharacterized integral membrane protein (TIGR00698 family)
MQTLILINALALRIVIKNAFVRHVAPLLPGLAFSALVAGVSIALGKASWFASHGISALTLAIMLGIALGNTVFARISTFCSTGVAFSKQNLLRLGIILYGFRLTFQDVAQVGMAGVAIDALVLSSTFALAMLLGIKVFQLDRHTAILIGAGSAICGAAAVMATQPVVRGRAEQVTVAVSTVVVFGTMAIFLYPMLYQLNLQWHLLDVSPSSFGIYAGSTIHEVAQVVAAARSVDPEAANAAVIAKMVRVMMLAPFLIILSACLARKKKPRLQHCTTTTHDSGKAGSLAIPWFAFVFIAVVGLNSAVSLPHGLVSAAIDLDNWLLAMAMAALGLTTHVSAIRRAGIKPLLLGALLFAWLVIGGAVINRLVSAFLV